jgi:hypothetical protein
LQVKPHLPALHVVVALARMGQAFPHIPQCEVDVLRSTQVIPQRVSEPHPLTQRSVAASHTGVMPEHVLPQPPQFIGVPNGVSQPFIGLPSQLA